ncbi:hypothetical protein HELRODRAFT_169534 [Helobdella robusta]|uniref:Uncharacterized protein n=1 Tax=Helobdella robusta TaxID=6412 RepID=T1F219_HELRO|nr:hypothetical protein HELRODRAFT_169534 [Helobdella robusta]ESO08646.1 hypothetical protein HELRODRAFT_169534 [Helobdella robusta]
MLKKLEKLEDLGKSMVPINMQDAEYADDMNLMTKWNRGGSEEKESTSRKSISEIYFKVFKKHDIGLKVKLRTYDAMMGKKLKGKPKTRWNKCLSQGLKRAGLSLYVRTTERTRAIREEIVKDGNR